MADVWVGSEVGYLKGVDLQRSSFMNYGPSTGERSQQVCAMCWADNSEEQICLGLTNGIVKTFDIHKREFVKERDCSGGEGTFKGLYKYEGSLVTCVESGLLRIWNESETPTEMKVGSHISRMRKNPECQSQLGTGGKENDLKVWDLNRPGQTIFRAKNVRNDHLDLQVPVWVTEIGFLPCTNTQPTVAVGTGYHQLRLYDTKAQKRPVLSVEFEDSPISAMAVTGNESVIIVGNTLGSMAAIDLRKGLPVGYYKGFAGSIRCIECHTKQSLVAACGLDRYLRVYDVNTRKLVQKVYLKSRLNCCLLSSHEINRKQGSEMPSSVDSHGLNTLGESLKRGHTDSDSAEEEEELWSKMDVITTEQMHPSTKTKKKKREKEKTSDKTDS